jgi:hypothetical protein
MRPLEVEIESRWRVNVRGPQSWELCRQAGRRKPAWSRVARAWVVSERTSRDVLAMAEAAGLNIVVTGPRTVTVPTQPAELTEQPQAVEWSLW